MVKILSTLVKYLVCIDYSQHICQNFAGNTAAWRCCNKTRYSFSFVYTFWAALHCLYSPIFFLYVSPLSTPGISLMVSLFLSWMSGGKSLIGQSDFKSTAHMIGSPLPEAKHKTVKCISVTSPTGAAPKPSLATI
jgi:hypothetical protein